MKTISKKSKRVINLTISLLLLFMIINVNRSYSAQFTEINPGSLTDVYSSSIVLVDIDNDGDLDLILTGSAGGTRNSKVYKNNGSGNFIFDANITPAVHQSSIALGDIDNDDDLDLILTGSWYDGTNTHYIARIYQNGGTGSFTEINPGSLFGVRSGSIALGDIDNDGDLDLILTGYNIINPRRFAKIYQNDGTGSFTEINPGSLSDLDNTSIALGDIDNDGDLDLILTGFRTSATSPFSKIYQNDGTGSFTEIYPGSLLAVGSGNIALGDIDGDGDLDLILTGGYYSGTWQFEARIYQNNGTGSFTEINPGSLSGVRLSSIALGDIDNDGDLDLILTGCNEAIWWNSRIFQNNGSGSFIEIEAGSLTPVRSSSIALGDIDNDADLDLIMTGDPAGLEISKIYRNNETITNIPPSIPAGMSGQSVNGYWQLSWNNSSDTYTVTNMLRYQIAIGTNSGVYNYTSTNIDYPRGQANLGKVTVVTGRPYYQTIIPATKDIYWKVCAIDSAFKFSSFCTQQVVNNIPIPSYPTNLVINYTNFFELGLKWSDNSTNENAFNIYRSIDTPSSFQLHTTVGSNVTVYTDKVLNSGTKYYYYVIATNEYGWVYTSNTNWAFTLPPPPAPQWISATIPITNQIYLKWNDTPNETSYTLFRSTVNNTNNATNIKGIIGGITKTNDIVPSPVTTYFYWLKAYNTGGSSPFSEVISGLVLPENFKGNIITNNGIAEASNIIVWEWTDNAVLETNYAVFNNGVMVSPLLAPNTTAWTEKGLLPNKKQTRYAVALINIQGDVPSNTNSRWTPAIPLADFAKIILVEKSFNFVRIQWDPSPAVTRYGVQRVEDAGGAPGTSWQTIAGYSEGITSNQYKDESVKSGMTYWYRIVVYNGDGVATKPSFDEFQVVVKELNFGNNKTIALNNFISPKTGCESHLYIKTPQDINDLIKIEIYTISGRKIKKVVNTSYRVISQPLVINYCNYASGVYLLKITGAGIDEVLKIFVTK